MPRAPDIRPLAVLLLLATLMLSACAGATAAPSAAPAATPAEASPTSSAPGTSAASGSSPGAPSASPLVPPSAPSLTFTSPRYPYSITLTRSWAAQPRPGVWKGFIVDTGAPGTDYYAPTAPSVDWNIEVGFLPVASATTLASWVAAEAPRAIVSDCRGRTPDPPISIGGHQVVLQRVTCPIYFGLSAYLVDGRRGVLVEWHSALGQKATDQAAFLSILATLKVR